MNHRTHREVREARALRQGRSGMPAERDVPESLHRRIKAECALRGVKMAGYLRQMLENVFPPK